MVLKEIKTWRHITLFLSHHSSDIRAVMREHIKNFAEKQFKKSHGRNKVFGYRIMLKFLSQEPECYE